MATYSIIMATFSAPVPTGTGTGSYVPFMNVAGFDFSTAMIEHISIEDDDPYFNDARGQKFSDPSGQTLTEPVTFGNDPAPTPATVRLTNFIQSTIEMLDPHGTGTGQTFKVLFPYKPPYTILGGKHSVLIFPEQTTAPNGDIVTSIFDPTASYKFKSYVAYPSDGSPYLTYPAPPCFTAGTLIDTQSGPRPVQTLRAGDFVRTRDNGMRRLHWVGGRDLTEIDLDLNPAFRPIRIRTGALGGGLPTSDLTVSPQHRVLVQSDLARQLFGAQQVLVAAKHLTDLPGISVIRDGKPVAYWHLLFDGHELVRSNGAWTESLYTGPQAMKSLSPAARREITMLFPELANTDLDPAPARARPFLTGQQGRKLARHLVRQQAALIDA